MINKQKLWFLTLFSLILVLSVYYITMPNELLKVNNKIEETNLEKNDTDEEVVVNIEESNILDTLKVESDEERLKEIEDLRLILTNIESSTDDKNNAYEKLKLIEEIKGKEEKLEAKIKSEYNLSSFIKINNNTIKVTIAETEHNYELANNIIRSIQEEYPEKMYITVKFQV